MKQFAVAVIVVVAVITFVMLTPQTFLSTDIRPFERISFLVDRSEPVEIDDGITIAGNYWEGTNGKGVILLHMMPATKESWNPLASLLNERGYSVLAIDLRGHGESTEYRIDDIAEVQRLDYRDFSDKQHQDSIRDVIGARDWFMERGIDQEHLLIGGASIGANLALQFISNHPGVPKGFILSPGADYHGIMAADKLSRVHNLQRAFLVAAEDDVYAADTVRKLHEQSPLVTERYKIYATGGHGTDLLESQRNLAGEIIEFFETPIE